LNRSYCGSGIKDKGETIQVGVGGLTNLRPPTPDNRPMITCPANDYPLGMIAIGKGLAPGKGGGSFNPTDGLD